MLYIRQVINDVKHSHGKKNTSGAQFRAFPVVQTKRGSAI